MSLVQISKRVYRFLLKRLIGFVWPFAQRALGRSAVFKRMDEFTCNEDECCHHPGWRVRFFVVVVQAIPIHRAVAGAAGCGAPGGQGGAEGH